MTDNHIREFSGAVNPLQSVTEAMADDPEVTADQACEAALNALDQLMVLAARDDTAPHVMANRIFVGQILVRAQLIQSFLMAKETPEFKMVSNNV